MQKYHDLCIYDIEPSENDMLEIVEFAPDLFKAIREKCGISE